jgi:hypothetical protein
MIGDIAKVPHRRYELRVESVPASWLVMEIDYQMARLVQASLVERKDEHPQHRPRSWRNLHFPACRQPEMPIAGNRPLIERVERQCDQEQEAKESCRQIVALPLHRVPEKEELADTTSSVALEQVTSRD